MYNYEEKIKRFVEDYATAVIGSENYSCEIDVHDEHVELIAVSSLKGGGSYNIATFKKSEVLGIDETQDESKPIVFMEGMTGLGVYYHEERKTICRYISNFFPRYCSIHAANLCLKNLNLEVVSEQQFKNIEKRELLTMRTNYYRFYVNEEMQRSVEFLFPDNGGIIERYLIDYIE